MSLKFIEAKTSQKFSRRELLMGFCALLAIGISLIFPKQTYGEAFWLSFFLFAIFPAVVAGRLLKEPLANFGFSLGNRRAGMIFSAAVTVVFVLANYFLVFHSKYGGQIPLVRGIAESFFLFLLFEIFVALPLHFFGEIFFRGFIQLGLEKKMGIFSLALAAVLQTALSFRAGQAAMWLVFFSSLGAGLVVRQSRSVFYSTVSLWLISASLDIMLIRMAHQIAN